MARHVALSLCAIIFACRCLAHIVLQKPVPYGNSTLNNSPLSNDGSDFPCKQREGVYDMSHMNYWKVGEKQTVQFSGSAVHGGGSCQFSITTDTEPTKGTQWKVIHSVVGGCPAIAEGNLRPGEQAASFEISLPASMPNGRYTLAWTWFNRRGQREMYMNCAPVTVTGGINNVAFFSKLPDMFVANLPRESCATVEDFDFSFPLPGDSVQTIEQGKLATTLVGSGCEYVTRLGAGAGSMRSQAVDTQLSRSPTALSRQVVSGMTNIAAPQVKPSQLSASIISAVPIATSTTNSVAIGTSCIMCDQDGDIVCIDNLHFGVCLQHCAVSQALAQGMSCLGGVIVK